MKRIFIALVTLSLCHFVTGDFAAMAEVAQQPYTGGIAVSSPRARAATASTRAGAVALPSRTGVGVAPSRNVATRAVATPSRNVAARAQQSRAVRSRTGIVPTGTTGARLSVQPAYGRGNANQVSGLYNRVNVGTYTSVLDANTGMIAADAYANCMESYYACMDEICTARNPGQRRCACAARVKTYTDIEMQLQAAREDIIRLNGELVLLELTRGKSVAAAFQLTEAEQVMNCVSYRDTLLSSNNKTEDMAQWCANHMMSNDRCSATVAPAYCATLLSSTWQTDLNGAESDIQAWLSQAAKSVDTLNIITGDNQNNLYDKYLQTSSAINEQYPTSSTTPLGEEENPVDKLASTWGYELFIYANNNICNRVLDACFNGIYETCGSHTLNGRSQTGPYNYNSEISVVGGDISFTTATNTSSTQKCFENAGYAVDIATEKTRPLVSDARRSILQRYALDANADCDVYGEELKVQAQNASYLRAAATQALQEKRLEYARTEATDTANALESAKLGYSRCLDQIITCYNDISSKNANNTTWNDTRTKSACNLIGAIPACYEQMICDKNAMSIVAEGTGRNVVTLTDIMATTPAVDCVKNDSNATYVRTWKSN
ncbi:MAG: hypothetical protein LBR41_00825 [Rickettsiales bacterium]|jgi:hypothetical protein|nr:hypothetical protein [Rickettsiales bacterium]